MKPLQLRPPSSSDGTSDAQDVMPGKPSAPVVRHARSSTRILKQWFTSHSAWPYPTGQEKDALSRGTGLTIPQISHWFVNARRRSSGKLSESAPATEGRLAVSSLPETFRLHHEQWDNMTPLERWRHSPPEEEPAPLHAISQALESNEIVYGNSMPRFGSYGDGTFGPFGATNPQRGSASSLESPTSGPSSDSSTHSHDSGSVSVFLGGGNRRSRRKRRLNTRHVLTDPLAQGSHARIYQCTFCTDMFKSRYDWTRHEGTLHLTLEQWTCLPYGPKHYNPGEDCTVCSLCDAPDPTDAHIQSHRAFECTAKPLRDRIFYRKDHLHQHLRISHGIDKMLPSMKVWKSKVMRVKSRCGFCGETFSLWSDRNDHLADHFKTGELMKDWKGDRGLEPAMSLLVQNAMPPYLIGTQSNDPEPFSASRGTLKTITSTTDTQRPPTVFEALTARLGDYVSASRANGTTITCDLLRREARLILYGDDDPWNQTPADNDQWLNLFKFSHGLVSDLDQPLLSVPAMNATLNAQIGPQAALSSPSTAHTTPFILQEIHQLTSSDSVIVQPEFNGIDIAVPWPWQTPECLAELRHMGQLPSSFNVSQIWNINGPDLGLQTQPACD